MRSFKKRKRRKEREKGEKKERRPANSEMALLAKSFLEYEKLANFLHSFIPIFLFFFSIPNSFISTEVYIYHGLGIPTPAVPTALYIYI